MELSRLEKYKKAYKAFASAITSLQSFLAEKEKARGVTLITPDYVSNRLNINEMDALFILSLAEREHIVKKKYSVFTDDTHNFLEEYDSADEIPKVIEDKETGNEIDRDHYYVSISFELEK